MGWYGKIRNRSKKQKVVGDWCKDTWCSCYQVMHQFHWDDDDKITSFGDETCYNMTYDGINNEIIKSEDIEFTSKIHCGEDEEPDEEMLQFQKEMENCKNYCFDHNEFKDDWDKYNHTPEWNDNKCIKCEYLYDKTKLPELEKRFQKFGRRYMY